MCRLYCERCALDRGSGYTDPLWELACRRCGRCSQHIRWRLDYERCALDRRQSQLPQVRRMQIHCGPALPAMRPVQPAHQVASGLRALRTRSLAKPAPTGPAHADPLWEQALPAMRPVQPAHQVASGLRALRTRSLARPAPTGPVHAGLLWEPALPAMRPVQPAHQVASGLRERCALDRWQGQLLQVRCMQIHCGSRPCRR
ncbi:hypothetical protein ABIE20_005287 [Pseudomonas sp. 2835]